MLGNHAHDDDDDEEEEEDKDDESMTDLHHERAATVSTTTVFSFHPARTNLIFPNCRLKWICILQILYFSFFSCDLPAAA